MPEADPIVFNHREIVETLVKKQKIRKGTWGLFVKFGLGATNTKGLYEGVVMDSPAAIVPVLEIGIREFDEPNSFTVDASKIGVKKRPAKKKVKAKKSAAKKKRTKRKAKR